MKEVSKFIPMDGNGGATNQGGNIGGYNGTINNANSSFKVCGANGSNLPIKTSFWSKLKGFLTYEIKVELTPYEQKVEDEINEFLHQDVTWQSFKSFLFQDITFGSKAE